MALRPALRNVQLDLSNRFVKLKSQAQHCSLLMSNPHIIFDALFSSWVSKSYQITGTANQS